MRRSSPWTLGVAVAAFRGLERLLPRDFRDQFGREVAETFEDECRDVLAESGLRRLPGLWAVCALDLLRVAGAEWARGLRRARIERQTRHRGGEPMESALKDLRYALRSLRRSPGFGLAAVATLAMGIGLNTALYSIAESVLWRPLPVPQPDRISLIYARGPEPGYGHFSFPDYRDIAASSDAFESLAGAEIESLSLARPGGTRAIWGEAVSANYFSTFGIHAERGRLFGPEVDSSPERAAVVVLSHGAWHRHFGGDPGIVGRVLTLNGQAITVVGVAPEHFRGAYSFWFAPEYWVPLGAYPALDPEGARRLEERGRTYTTIVARLRPGVRLQQAQAQLTAIASLLAKDHPSTNADRRAVILPELATRPEVDTAAAARLAFGVFQGLAVLVLLVACANIANLLLARGCSRVREMAVRLAIGASRGRLVRLLLAEGALLGAASAVLGLGLAKWIVWQMSHVSLPTYFPIAVDLQVDGTALAFALALTSLTVLAFGLVPAIQVSRPDLVPTLKDGASRGSGRRARLMGALVAAQVAVSLVLLVAGGLFLRSMEAARGIPLGFRTDHALLATVGLDQPGYDTARRHQLALELAERIGAAPGVADVTLSSPVPMEFNGEGGRVYAEGRESPTSADLGDTTLWAHVGPGYFKVMETGLVAGRPFRASDDASAPGVAIVNETLAERLWPGRNPIGRTLRIEAPDANPLTVIGEARDGKYRAVFEPPLPYLFLPVLQHPVGNVTVVARTQGDPAAMAASVRAAIRAVDPTLPVLDVKSFTDLLEGRALLPFRVGAGIGGIVGLLALGLAMVGLTGVIGLAVTRRTREIGIRMALGARRSQVLAMVLLEGMRLLALGAGFGLVLVLTLGRALRGLLVGVTPSDPVTLASVTVGLTALTLLATYLPARRAARVDPAAALRAE